MKARRSIAQPQRVHLLAKGARSARLCGASAGAFIRLNQEGIAYLKRFLRERGTLCSECSIAAARDHGLVLSWTFETGVGARRAPQLQGKFR